MLGSSTSSCLPCPFSWTLLVRSTIHISLNILTEKSTKTWIHIVIPVTELINKSVVYQKLKSFFFQKVRTRAVDDGFTCHSVMWTRREREMTFLGEAYSGITKHALLSNFICLAHLRSLTMIRKQYERGCLSPFLAGNQNIWIHVWNKFWVCDLVSSFDIPVDLCHLGINPFRAGLNCDLLRTLFL